MLINNHINDIKIHNDSYNVNGILWKITLRICQRFLLNDSQEPEYVYTFISLCASVRHEERGQGTK